MSFLIFLFILGVLIVVHEFGHFIIAKKIGVRVDKFSLGFGPRILSKKKNDTMYSISAIPLGGYVKLAGDNLEEYKGGKDEYFSQAPGRRFWIIFFGSFLNYVLGFLLLWLIFFMGYPTLTTKVGGLKDGFGAQASGVQVGDVVTAVDGQKVTEWDELQKIIRAKKQEAVVRLSVLRRNQEYTIDVSVKEDKVADELGQKKSAGLLGISASNEIIHIRHPFLKSFVLSLEKTWSLTVLTYKAIGRMITGRMSVRESVTGPLGMFYITSQAASVGLIALLHLVSLLSISLAIFNLLPLPVLDGGHIVLLAIEKIRGKTLSLKVERVINNIGLSLIISIGLIVTYNDILRFFGQNITKFFK